MEWRGRRGSTNIEDRRGRPSRGAFDGGCWLGLLAIIGIGGFLGVDVIPPLEEEGQPVQTEITAADRETGEFVRFVLADTGTTWSTIFESQLRRAYAPNTLVLYKGVTQSACGGASGATGPSYGPGDRKFDLDTDFWVTMDRPLGAGGDFAVAYVVAHEVAHHVQDELGVLSRANDVRARVGKAESNAISVMIDLQADCYSGIWARYADEFLGTLKRGDIGEAVNAAKQIGDDTLQLNAERIPMPHTFTHGTRAQRQRWCATAYQTGDLAACDTLGSERT